MNELKNIFKAIDYDKFGYALIVIGVVFTVIGLMELVFNN